MWIKLMDLHIQHVININTSQPCQPQINKILCQNSCQASFGSKLTALGSKLTAFGSKLMALGSKLAKFMALGLKLIALGSKLEMGATGAIGASAYLGQVCKNCKNCNKWSCKNTFDTVDNQTNWPQEILNLMIQSKMLCSLQQGKFAIGSLPAKLLQLFLHQVQPSQQGKKTQSPSREREGNNAKTCWHATISQSRSQTHQVRIKFFQETTLTLWCFKRLSTDKQATKPNLYSSTCTPGPTVSWYIITNLPLCKSIAKWRSRR